MRILPYSIPFLPFSFHTLSVSLVWPGYGPMEKYTAVTRKLLHKALHGLKK